MVAVGGNCGAAAAGAAGGVVGAAAGGAAAAGGSAGGGAACGGVCACAIAAVSKTVAPTDKILVMFRCCMAAFPCVEPVMRSKRRAKLLLLALCCNYCDPIYRGFKQEGTSSGGRQGRLSAKTSVGRAVKAQALRADQDHGIAFAPPGRDL